MLLDKLHAIYHLNDWNLIKFNIKFFLNIMRRVLNMMPYFTIAMKFLITL